jgi:FkbM family methyltransferase
MTHTKIRRFLAMVFAVMALVVLSAQLRSLWIATLGHTQEPNINVPSQIRPHQSQPLSLYSKSTEPIYIPEPLLSKDMIRSGTNFPLMSLLEIYSIVYEYASQMKHMKFPALGRLIYESALEKNRTLLTLQIGGMDGISNDPMHNMFVRDSPLNLHNWFPIVVEPVTTNFEQLTKNYAHLQATRGLPGMAIRQYAITSEHDMGTCEFCRWDETVDEICASQPDWVKSQLGSLDCAHVEGRSVTAKLCTVREKCPCGTVSELLASLGLATAPIGILQIDVEGYEVFILQQLMDEILDENLPLFIHFEHKVMRSQDERNMPGRKVNGTKIETIFKLLHRKGYVMYDQSEDVLALRLNRILQV